MKAIPSTSPDRYITGFDALNIPLRDGTAADWHFTAAFVESGKQARVAGLNYPGTSDVFGAYGIRECGAELRAGGHVGTDGQVWAADFVRAILDLVYRSAAVEGVCPDHVPAADLLDRESDRRALAEKLAELKGKVSDKARKLIEEWESRQSA